MMKTETIDCEPKWEAILRMVDQGHCKADVLKPAVEFIDIIRQAQKKGSKKVILTFKDGKINIDDGLPEVKE